MARNKFEQTFDAFFHDSLEYWGDPPPRMVKWTDFPTGRKFAQPPDRLIFFYHLGKTIWVELKETMSRRQAFQFSRIEMSQRMFLQETRMVMENPHTQGEFLGYLLLAFTSSIYLLPYPCFEQLEIAFEEGIQGRKRTSVKPTELQMFYPEYQWGKNLEITYPFSWENELAVQDFLRILDLPFFPTETELM